MSSALDRLKNFGKPNPINETPIVATPTIDPDVADAVVAKLVTCESCSNQQKALTKVGKLLLCDSCARAEKEVIKATPKPLVDTTPETSKADQKVQDQIATMMNDPIAEYLDLNVEDLQNEERKKIFNDVALRLATATITEINEEYDRKMHYLKLVHFEAHMILLNKSQKIKNASTKRKKEEMLLEDVTWQQTRAAKGTKSTVKKTSKIITKTDLELQNLPADIRDAVRSMIKAGLAKDVALRFIQDAKLKGLK